jgi:hypothetical protein
MLTRLEMDRLVENNPLLRMTLLDNLLRNVADRVASLSAEVAAFAG